MKGYFLIDKTKLISGEYFVCLVIVANFYCPNQFLALILIMSPILSKRVGASKKY